MRKIKILDTENMKYKCIAIGLALLSLCLKVFVVIFQIVFMVILLPFLFFFPMNSVFSICNMLKAEFSEIEEIVKYEEFKKKNEE